MAAGKWAILFCLHLGMPAGRESLTSATLGSGETQDMRQAAIEASGVGRGGGGGGVRGIRSRSYVDVCDYCFFVDGLCWLWAAPVALAQPCGPWLPILPVQQSPSFCPGGIRYATDEEFDSASPTFKDQRDGFYSKCAAALFSDILDHCDGSCDSWVNKVYETWPKKLSELVLICDPAEVESSPMCMQGVGPGSHFSRLAFEGASAELQGGSPRLLALASCTAAAAVLLSGLGLRAFSAGRHAYAVGAASAPLASRGGVAAGTSDLGAFEFEEDGETRASGCAAAYS